jgi:hypothetical protein
MLCPPATRGPFTCRDVAACHPCPTPSSDVLHHAGHLGFLHLLTSSRVCLWQTIRYIAPCRSTCDSCTCSLPPAFAYGCSSYLQRLSLPMDQPSGTAIPGPRTLSPQPEAFGSLCDFPVVNPNYRWVGGRGLGKVFTLLQKLTVDLFLWRLQFALTYPLEHWSVYTYSSILVYPLQL